MMRISKTLLFNLFFIFSTGAWAQSRVDLQEGSFHLQERDRLTLTKGSALELERAYSSRSDHQGLLGRGWCSELEMTLVVTDSSALLLKCDQPQVLPRAQITRLAGRIRLKTDRGLFYFRSDGRLEAFEKNKIKWTIGRNLLGKPTYLESQKGETLLCVYNGDQGLLTALVGERQRLSFVYRQDLLAQVKGETQRSYRYSEFSNLVETQNLAIGYDEARDTVTAVRDEKGCLTQYDYLSIETPAAVSDRVTVSAACPGKPKTRLQHDFEYSKLPDHRIQIDRVSTLSLEAL